VTGRAVDQDAQLRLGRRLLRSGYDGSHHHLAQSFSVPVDLGVFHINEDGVGESNITAPSVGGKEFGSMA
jgi:hypothetical protein